MTLLEYIEQGCKYHDTIMKYINFRTFVESLERKSNRALIESISTGVSYILEAEVSNFQVQDLTPSESPDKKGGDGSNELTTLVNELKKTQKGTSQYEAVKKKVVGFLTQIILKLARKEAKSNNELFTDLSSDATLEMMQKFDSVLGYDQAQGNPATFVMNKFMLPAKRKSTKDKNLDFAYTTSPSKAMFAHLKADKGSYGKILNPDTNDDGSTVTVKWDHTGKKDPVYVGDTEEIPVTDLKFYNMESDTYKTSLASTGIDSSDGGQTETLGDTSAFADKSGDYEDETEKQGGVLDSAIEWTADALATRMAKNPDGSVDDAKHEKLYDAYYKFLEKYAYSKDAGKSDAEALDTAEEQSGAGSSESALEKTEARKALITKKVKQYQNFVTSVGKILLSQGDKLKQVLGEDFNPEETLLKFKGMTASPPKGTDRKVLATGENIKKLLGDKLYNIIYGLPAQKQQIDNIDATEAEISGLEDVRTKTKRVGSTLDEVRGKHGQDSTVDMKTGKALIELLKKFHTGE